MPREVVIAPSKVMEIVETRAVSNSSDIILGKGRPSQYSSLMPHIRFRALKEDQVRQLSSELSPVLASAVQTSEDNFTFELIGTQFFVQGKTVESYPIVEVLWFARSQDIQDQCAGLITEKVKSISNAEDVIVVFSVLEKSAYYENGKHF